MIIIHNVDVVFEVPEQLHWDMLYNLRGRPLRSYRVKSIVVYREGDVYTTFHHTNKKTLSYPYDYCRWRRLSVLLLTSRLTAGWRHLHQQLEECCERFCNKQYAAITGS